MIRKIDFNNNISFQAIKLTNSDFCEVRNIVTGLKFKGYKDLGHMTYYVENNFSKKRDLFSSIRKYTGIFGEKNYGVVFIEDINEAYILSDVEHEQTLLPLVRKFDKGAVINLLL